jgi:hypothetical protein
MNLVGGLRKNIGDYDFKYTTDNTRINWIKSVFPYMETLVNTVANIPYSSYKYYGDVVYTYIGETNLDGESDKYVPPELQGIEPKTNVINHAFKEEGNNSLDYSFFGGTCFELLNDAYKNVNLYDFVDPTSDIDIAISAIMPEHKDTEIYNELMRKNRFNEIIKKLCLVVDKSLEEPDLVPYLNPYFRDISNFIFENMLTNLNQINLNFKNSVPFDINEYESIENEVKNDELGYIVQDIQNSNAKLVCYLDSDLKTLRIQIILKVVVDDEIIIDHLLEFLVTSVIPTRSSIQKWIITIPAQNAQQQQRSSLEGQTINISTLDTLIDDNLEAYKKREYEAEIEGPRRHKPINHITRIIYLLNLIKNNPDVYDSLLSQIKGVIRGQILKQIVSSYVYYKIINDEFILNNINTIDIVYAFYTLFVKLMQIPMYIKSLSKKINSTINEISKNEEEKKYNSLMTLFRMNASLFRKIISKQMPQKSSRTQFMEKMRSRELDEVDETQKALKQEYNDYSSNGRDKYIMSTDKPPNYGGRKTRRKKHKKTHRKKVKNTYKSYRKRTRRNRRR